MPQYGNYTDLDLANHLSADSIINNASGTASGSWKKEYVAGTITSITMTIDGVDTVKTGLAAITIAAYITTGIDETITSISLTDGYAVLYK